MPMYRNAFQDYTDDHWEPPTHDPDEFWICGAGELSTEELVTLQRYLSHVLEHGDDVPFDWPPHLDPDRLQRIPITQD